MMQPENNVRAQIRKHPVFVGLSETQFDEVLRGCVLKTYKKNEKVLYSKTPREGLLLILNGVAEVFVAPGDFPLPSLTPEQPYAQKEVLEVLQTGDMIGFSSLADFLGGKTEEPERYAVDVQAVEDAVCLHIPYSVIQSLWGDPGVRDFILQQAAVRLQDVYASFAEQIRLANKWGESEPFIRRIHDVMSQPVISADIDDDVQDVAALMVQYNTSSVVVVNDNGQLIGIVTEKDLVQRVVAKGLGAGLCAKDVMTPHPFIISRDAYYYEAMSSFLMNGVKHLPVMDGGRVIGMVTLSDLLRKKNRGTLELLQSVEQSTLDNIAEIKPAMYEVLAHLIQDGIPTAHLLEVMTKLYDRLVRHAIELALKMVGKPPVPFVFYMMGSGGRGEQFLLTDQDHFLVYENPKREYKEGVDRYFERLGTEIVMHMEAAGYKRCPGLMMASEANWRGSLDLWQERWRSWALRATNENLLLAHNFLSFRYLYGEEELHDQFCNVIKQQLEKSRIFLYRMAELEKEQPVPTFDHPIRALFRMKKESVDLKKHALFPLHHCLQLLCAKYDLLEGHSLQQIDLLTEHHVFSEETADKLRFAYEVILRIRVDRTWTAHQKGRESSSEVEFNQLKTKDKEELMMALRTIRSLQNQVLVTFGLG
ncbi:Inosine-5'-monophosphate dehydrogenase [Halalkalibacter krulwichiae]|uniref:Inosine-5'-monophosphate dehydrogenase n=2 Tax=Halalkalibacter krulwichiae TaxID=199441 RepID=A0A1X9MLI1_9BACI|nr:Inosine-5'-monophosphate dehydrogenase [Halalkalibacter krulwichiae]